jgi:1,4-dihydroxy-2-naphthoate polyprenyltransferase
MRSIKNSNKIQAWIQTCRPHTLALAFSGVAMGTVSALFYGFFDWLIFLMSLSTAVLLQTLSNLSNDYGDHFHGSDRNNRIGPIRGIHTGLISPDALKKAVYMNAILAFFSGLLLLVFSLNNIGIQAFIVFLLLGILSIWAAYFYTASKNPYGYKGLGDIFVFLFFGILSVSGTFYLQSARFYPEILLPACSIGLFSTAVLNINNIRDHENDKKNNKKTLVVIMGPDKALIYHIALIITGITSGVCYAFLLFDQLWQFIPLILLVFLLKHLIDFLRIKEKKEYNIALKQLVKAVVFFVLAFVLSYAG